MSASPTAQATTLEAVCTRKDLSEGIQLVGQAVSERNPLPILTHLLVQSHENGLLLSASDLELGISMVIPADVRRAGALTAPAKLLAELVSSFPDGEITLSGDRSHAVQLYVPGSDYRIVGLPPEEYPALPQVDDANVFSVPEKLLRDAIRQTIFAASADVKARPILTGVLIDFEASQATFVATDTMQMALRSVPVTDASGKAQVVVPSRALADLQKALTEGDGLVEVRLSATLAQFRTPRGVTVTTRLIEGQYPQYRRVIPTTCRTRVTLPTTPLHQAVRRAYIVARHASDRLDYAAVEDKVVLTAESVTDGKALEEIEAIKDGDDIRLSFRAKHLVDILSVVDSDGVSFEFTDATKAVVVRPKPEDPAEAGASGEFLCILMPLQLL